LADPRPPAAQQQEVLLRWSAAGRRLEPAAGPAAGLDVADSWLVCGGMVRGLDYHAERFAGSCQRRHGVPVPDTMEFLLAAAAVLPRDGRWFPRVEFDAGDGFRLRLRPAPPPSDGVVLGRMAGPDPRRDPAVKGPDLAMLAALRQQAQPSGAGEVLLVSADGLVLEGALSALLWWRGDVLCAPPLTLPVLPSVTRRLLLDIAAETGTPVRFEACRPEDLDGAELWSASALHGIRPVTAWAAAGLAAGAARRAGHWQGMLAARARPAAAAARAMAAHRAPVTASPRV
jgi:branched-subunit amino acid aminotransferase/4-amino-4-deoxychorismate lyase